MRVDRPSDGRRAANDEPREDVGVVWVDERGAVLVRWEGEPTLERVESNVPPRHRQAGSLRRGPARPAGGGKVHGLGTEREHEALLRRFLVDLAIPLTQLDELEILGRGLLHRRLAELLQRLAARDQRQVSVTAVPLTRRPSDRQLAARLRRLAGAELPRKLVGRYRLPPREPTSSTGRPLDPAAGRRTLRPARLPERQEIAEELEQMLADEPDSGAPTRPFS
ncbi:MAG TPA: hypothetical protein VFW92_08910 [Candidatus Limnocylindrales bacterium]|nr:hypothetical protein [Candidatus Limnocylindrales bacterium]